MDKKRSGKVTIVTEASWNIGHLSYSFRLSYSVLTDSTVTAQDRKL
jgi:hypothetical protein